MKNEDPPRALLLSMLLIYHIIFGATDDMGHFLQRVQAPTERREVTLVSAIYASGVSAAGVRHVLFMRCSLQQMFFMSELVEHICQVRGRQ